MIENPNVKMILELVHAVSGVLLEKHAVPQPNRESFERPEHTVLESQRDNDPSPTRVRTIQRNKPE